MLDVSLKLIYSFSVHEHIKKKIFHLQPIFAIEKCQLQLKHICKW